MKKRLSAIGFLGALCLGLTMCFCLTPAIGQVPADCIGAAVTCLYFLPGPGAVLGMNNTNNFSARESFNKAVQLLTMAMKDKFANEGEARAWVMSRKLSQGEIRLEVKMNATSNNFVFGLTTSNPNSNGVVFNTENRLTMQDTLVASEYGLFVGLPANDTDTAWELKTYGSQPTFSAAGAAVLNTTFYDHGAFKMTANNDVIIPYRGLFNHWYRGQTQQTAAFGAGSPADQIRGAEDGMVTMEPNILLIGSKGYVPQIFFPTSLTNLDANTRAVLIFRGVLAQNSTSVS